MWRSIPEPRGALRLGAAAVALSAGCSPQQRSDEVDIANAARAAQESVGNYADTLAPASPPTPAVSAPAPAPSPRATVPDRAPSDGPNAEAAAQVLRHYFALIAQHRYRAAWQLWDRDGAASGLSPDAFAESFAKYRDYDAEVGAPGRIDAGAGQRYVTIPVTVTGTLRDGRPFTLEGPVTLHRAADIDGATEAQRSWRLYESGLKPRPAPRSSTSATPQAVTAHYRCRDGSAFEATFDTVRDTATLALPSGKVRLVGQQPASGIWYAGEGYELRGKGKDATLTPPNGPPLSCRAGG